QPSLPASPPAPSRAALKNVHAAKPGSPMATIQARWAADSRMIEPPTSAGIPAASKTSATAARSASVHSFSRLTYASSVISVLPERWGLQDSLTAPRRHHWRLDDR